MFAEFFKRYWNHPIGILIVFLFELWLTINSLPEKDGNWTKFILLLILLLVVLIIYSIFVYATNRTPSASKGKLGVLIIITAENETVYKSIQYDVEQNFLTYSTGVSTPIQPVFINPQRVKVPNICDKKRMTELLQRTNCVFCANLVVQVDDSNNAENFLLKTNAGIIHPRFSAESNLNIEKELVLSGQNLKQITFSKSQKIPALAFATQQMTFAVQYMIGLVLLYCGDAFEAEKYFNLLLLQANPKNCSYYEHICKKYSIACLYVCAHYENKFMDEYDKACLDEALKYLEKFNQYSPNTYTYHLNAAWILFLKNRQIQACKQHIQECRHLAQKNEASWKLSEVFLLAYESNNAGLIYRKYNSAIKFCFSKDNSINYIYLVDYIEYVLEAEPDRVMLNLVLAILYNAIGDTSRSINYAKCFIKVFPLSEKDKDVKVFLTTLISNQVSEDCKKSS